MTPETIAERATNIRLPDIALGKLAGLHENTVSRTLSRATRPLHDTVQALEAALIAEEVRLRDYLLALHPISTTDEGQAT